MGGWGRPDAAEVARDARARDCRGEVCGVTGAPKVARERQREPGARRGAAHHRDRRLRHLVEPARDLHAPAEGLGALLEGRALGLAPLGHRLDVAARAEAAPGAGEDDGAHLRVVGEPGQRRQERVEHRPRHGVQAVGAIQREDGDAVLDGLEQILGHGGPPVTTCAAMVPSPREAAMLAMKPVKAARHPYDVDRPPRHPQRPGFWITELQISPTQQVPWHYHTSTQDTFYVLDGRLRLFLRDPKVEVPLSPGQTYTLRPRPPHLVTNPCKT